MPDGASPYSSYGIGVLNLVEQAVSRRAEGVYLGVIAQVECIVGASLDETVRLRALELVDVTVAARELDPGDFEAMVDMTTAMLVGLIGTGNVTTEAGDLAVEGFKRLLNGSFFVAPRTESDLRSASGLGAG